MAGGRQLHGCTLRILPPAAHLALWVHALLQRAQVDRRHAPRQAAQRRRPHVTGVAKALGAAEGGGAEALGVAQHQEVDVSHRRPHPATQ